MEVRRLAAEEQSPEETQQWIADIPVMPRHRSGGDAALEAIPHHQLVAGPQRRDEGIEIGEVVAVIGVAHDDIAAKRRLDSGRERGAVATHGDGHDPRPLTLGDLPAAVGRAVVGDDDFANDPRALQETLCLADAGGERLGLVEAGHQDGELEFGQANRPGGRCADYSGCGRSLHRLRRLPSAWPRACYSRVLMPGAMPPNIDSRASSWAFLRGVQSADRLTMRFASDRMISPSSRTRS
jgi:hypothetical protein